MFGKVCDLSILILALRERTPTQTRRTPRNELPGSVHVICCCLIAQEIAYKQSRNTFSKSVPGATSRSTILFKRNFKF